MTTAQKKTPRALRLNSVSVPMEAFFHLVLGLFSLLCIIPFVFVVIIAAEL